MQTIKQTKKTDFSIYFFFYILISLCFITSKSNNDIGINNNSIVVTTFNVNSIYIIIGICMVFMLYYMLRKMYIDKITIALIISVILGIIPFTYSINTNNYFGNYFSVIVSFIAYFVCSNSKFNFLENIYRILCLVCIIISAQVIFTEFSFFSTLSLSNLNNVSVKVFMKIPIGSSNKIAAYLLPLIVFIISYKRNALTFLISLISLYAMILCRSKNALSLIFILIIFAFFKRIYTFVLKDKSIGKIAKLIVISTMTLILVVTSVFILNILMNIISKLGFDSYISPYSNNILNFVDTISSGRLVIYSTELARFLDHIFLGNGFGYEIGYARSHNWIIEVMVQRGLLGLLIYLYSIISVFKIGKPYYDDRFIRASRNLLIIIFIQGLFEITVFTIGIDFLIWSISGFIIARVKYLNDIKITQ